MIVLHSALYGLNRSSLAGLRWGMLCSVALSGRIEYIQIMPSTTIHIPPTLLAALDAKAKSRGLSRNRLILQALEKMLAQDDCWDFAFLEKLRQPVSPTEAQEVDEMMVAIQRQRTQKEPPPL